MQDADNAREISRPSVAHTRDQGAGIEPRFETLDAALGSLEDTFRLHAEALAQAARGLAVDAGALESVFVFDDDLVSRIQARIEEAFLPTQAFADRIRSRMGVSREEGSERAGGPVQTIKSERSAVVSAGVGTSLNAGSSGVHASAVLSKTMTSSETVDSETLFYYERLVDRLVKAGFGIEAVDEVLGVDGILGEGGISPDQRGKVLSRIIQLSILGKTGELSSFEGGRYKFLAQEGRKWSPLQTVENLSRVYRTAGSEPSRQRDIEHLIGTDSDDARYLLETMVPKSRRDAAAIGRGMVDGGVKKELRDRYQRNRRSCSVTRSSDYDPDLVASVATAAFEYENLRIGKFNLITKDDLQYYLEGWSPDELRGLLESLAEATEAAKARGPHNRWRGQTKPHAAKMKPLSTLMRTNGLGACSPYSGPEESRPSGGVLETPEPASAPENGDGAIVPKGEESGFLVPGGPGPDHRAPGALPAAALPLYALSLPGTERWSCPTERSAGSEMHAHTTDVVINVTVNTPDAADGRRIGRDIAETLKSDYTHLLDVSNTPLRIA
ncbi:hypothetical protein IHV25_07245 [Phaeovibrio sulfidiphilus]|uniref:Uncharacterized protein n=1 Tax=Phaeovibrio sulfidiphilus TaxID=1220600 RepID=A0A8J7CPT9_9PROT|nr:hypothetical protein [Phaeovibrio sulfidiphilus]MBE1237442.1 hypothetical protein [Phaeovibrio sulfidiphilus]